MRTPNGVPARTYDAACYDLAAKFVNDEELQDKLAAWLQDTVEDFLGGQWRDGGGEDRGPDRRLYRALAHAGLSTDWR